MTDKEILIHEIRKRLSEASYQLLEFIFYLLIR